MLGRSRGLGTLTQDIDFDFKLMSARINFGHTFTIARLHKLYHASY
jgi:hypothetical protein